MDVTLTNKDSEINNIRHENKQLQQKYDTLHEKFVNVDKELGIANANKQHAEDALRKVEITVQKLEDKISKNDKEYRKSL